MLAIFYYLIIILQIRYFIYCGKPFQKARPNRHVNARPDSVCDASQPLHFILIKLEKKGEKNKKKDAPEGRRKY